MRFASLILVPLALTLAACSGSTADSADPGSEDALIKKGTGTVEVTEADNNKVVTVEQGKDIRVSLGEVGGTGFRWSVTTTDKSLGYPDPKDGTFSDEHQGAGGGGGGARVFVWKTNSPLLQPGSLQPIKLEYRRPWETNKPAANTFTLKVKIKAAGAPPAPKDLTLDKGDDGKTEQVSVGQKVTVRLAQNSGSTGYAWHVVSVDKKLGDPETDFEAGEDHGPGSGGTALFSWTPNDAAVGKRAIKLKLSRGDNGAAAETFEVTLDVAK